MRQSRPLPPEWKAEWADRMLFLPFCVGRCEVDGQSGHGPVKGAGLCGGTDALSGFGYRAGRQTDDIQPGKTAGEEALDGDNVAVNAAQSCGEYARYHADPSDTYGITI